MKITDLLIIVLVWGSYLIMVVGAVWITASIGWKWLLESANRSLIGQICAAGLVVVFFFLATSSVKIGNATFWLIAVALFFVIIHLLDNLGQIGLTLGIHNDEPTPIDRRESSEDPSITAIVQERQRVAEACSEPLRRVRRTIYMLVAGVLVACIIWSASDRNQRVIDYTNWRDGVIGGATTRSRGGGCGTVVRQYFDDIAAEANGVE
jgi:hypothetical protein